MKRTFALLTIVSAAPFAAHAQSSVTLYGVIAGGLAWQSNAQTAATSADGRPRGNARVAMLDAGASGPGASRWGMKGVEDLGGGFSALFALESGFNFHTGALGQGGTMFGRQAWIGVSGGRYGTVTVGRQGDLAVEYVWPLLYTRDFGNLAIHPADYDNLNFTRRINNAVKYVSDSFGGLRLGALYSFGGVPGSAARNQYWSAGASYAGGPLVLGASIINARDPNASLHGTNANASATGNNFGSPGSAHAPETNAAIAGFASARTQQTVAVAATYAAGAALVGAAWSNTQFRGLGHLVALNPLNYAGNASFNTVGVSLRYRITPFLRAGASFDYTSGGNVHGKGSARYRQFNAGAAYALSKATELYATAAFQHASGTDSWRRPATANIGYLTPSATSRQVALSAGVKHLF